MPLVDARPEINAFTQDLAGKPEELFVEEAASYSMETNGIPDPYYYTLDEDGNLYHPEGRTKVRNFVSRDNYIYELEYQALAGTENWFRRVDSGTMVWVSPPSPGLYPTSKIIISEIEGEGKGKKAVYQGYSS